MNKRALYVVGQLGIGGHVRAALAYASELRCRGWSITFCGSDSGGGDLVLERGFPLIRVEPIVQGEFFATARAIRDAARWEPNVIHSFDLASLPFAASVGARTRARLVHTICGGKTPWYPLPVWDGLAVMSDELADDIGARAGRRPNVIRGRMCFAERVSAHSRADLRRVFSLEEGECVAMMISRTCATKMGSLRAFVAIVSALAERHTSWRWRGVICGGGDDELLRSELGTLCERVNNRFGRTVLTRDASYVREAFQALPLADVFMGVGDAFAEAAINRVPSLVVGEAGYAGMLSKDSAAELYRFNLSGRNVAVSEQPEQTADRIVALLSDRPARLAAVEFARSSVLDNLGVDGAVDAYEQLYRAATPSSGILRLRLLVLRALFGIRKYYLMWVPARLRRIVLRARGMA